MRSPLATPSPSAPAGRTLGARLLAVGGVLALLTAGLSCLLVIGIDVGPVALSTGLIAATVPVPLYVFVALRVDRFEPEPVRLLAWAFFWGASAATLIGLVLNTAGQELVGSSFGSHVGELYGSSISAPVVEEGAKGAVLFALFRWRRRDFNGVLDGVVYAAMVGLGFAMTENVLYYGRATVEGGIPLAVTFFFRGVMAPFCHPVFTAMTGIGLGLAVASPRRAIRVIAPIAGLVAAILLHSLWNTSATLGGGVAFFGVFALVMVPVFVALIVVVAVGLRRDSRAIATHLAGEVRSGVLGPGDVIVLSTLGDRGRLRRAARRDGGAHRRACREWMRTATDLAFLRQRRQRGTLHASEADAAAQEGALAARLAQLRPQLGPATGVVAQAASQRSARAAQIVAARTPTAARPSPGVHAPLPPAAWYHDPWGQATWRWWDGGAWTHHLGA